jgi:hypothetical protein
MRNNYILVDAKTHAPVPLPFETTYKSEPVRVVDWYPPGFDSGWDGWCRLSSESIPRLLPSVLGLKLITEAAFMAEQEIES